ncbi:VPLPA-CTERM sorting domain-containing protein [Salipiger sp.]|uniref:VPLPA-CTERM sorting domain-containing protein n=1 Tax=Salipiger sp. TaxID=2078585 RepID=UPI003A98711C
MLKTMLFTCGLIVAPLVASAFPIAPAGTEGLYVVATGGEVTATYEGNSASWSNDLYLVQTSGDVFLFNNHASSVGASVVLGTFAAGTELIFRLFVNNNGNSYYTGPGSRNWDGQAHARVQTEYMPGTTLVSFEDGGDGAFNDLSFTFTGTSAVEEDPGSTVPLPAGAALLVTGLAGLAGLRRRKGKA